MGGVDSNCLIPGGAARRRHLSLVSGELRPLVVLPFRVPELLVQNVRVRDQSISIPTTLGLRRWRALFVGGRTRGGEADRSRRVARATRREEFKRVNRDGSVSERGSEESDRCVFEQLRVSVWAGGALYTPSNLQKKTRSPKGAEARVQLTSTKWW